MNISPELIEACIEKKRTAQKRLYELCFGYMMAICLRYERNREDAEFLVNLAFFKVLTRLETFKKDAPMRPWLKRITLNTIIDEFRKKKTVELHYHETPEIFQNGMMTANDVDVQYGVEDLERLIQKLPEISRKVFNLYAIDGYGHKEIADMLGFTEGTSKWHLHNARQKLRESLEQMNTKALTR